MLIVHNALGLYSFSPILRFLFVCLFVLFYLLRFLLVCLIIYFCFDSILCFGFFVFNFLPFLPCSHYFSHFSYSCYCFCFSLFRPWRFRIVAFSCFYFPFFSSLSFLFPFCFVSPFLWLFSFYMKRFLGLG